MISSRFGPNRKDVEPEPEASLNNVTDELRKSSRSIDDDDVRKKEKIYGKPRVQEPSVNVQQYSKNAYGKLDTTEQDTGRAIKRIKARCSARCR